jgi:adenylate kinase
MNIILLGAPGSGKGTQAEYISTKYNLERISTGDLLRAEIANQSQLGQEIKAIVESGKLVDDKIMSKLISKKLQSSEYDKGAIFDGFPRTIAQAEILDSILSEQGKKIDIVFELVVKEEDLVTRLSNRYHCKKCNAGYNKLFKNPKHDHMCDVCHGTEFVIREDDKPEVIKKRFHAYQTQTELLLPYYDSKGLIHKLNGQEDMKEVSKNIDLIIKQVIAY